MTPNSAPLNLDDQPAANGTHINSNNYINSSSYHKLHNMNVAFQLMEDANIPVGKLFFFSTKSPIYRFDLFFSFDLLFA